MKRLVWIGAVAVALVLTVVLALRARTPAAPFGGEEETASPLVAVHVAPIVRTTLHSYIDTWGTVEPQPATERLPPASGRVSTPVAGILAEVSCAEGQRTLKGAYLFSLDGRVADLAVVKAKQNLQFLEQAFSRQRLLGPGEATSQKLYQEAEQNLVAARNELRNAQTQRALLDIAAPLAGTIIKVNAKPGDAVDLTTVLAEIIDLDRLVVSTVVRSADVARVRTGQLVQLTARGSASDPSAPSPDVRRGVVIFIGAAVDGKNDTVPVRASVPAGAGLRPGQFVDARILVEERRDRLAVPVESVVSEGGSSAIAVVTGNTAVKRPVRAGLREGSLVEVEGEGLQEGMTVVAAGAYGLPKESRIRVIGR
jgi:membrane fusion protein, multidrug efflux system